MTRREHVPRHHDICEDKRLAKVHKTMRGFGDQLQYSVFECQFYNETRQRVRVVIDDELTVATIAQVEQARKTAEARRLPPPLVDSPKCPRCSLVSICLPDETAVSMALAEPDEEQSGLFVEDIDRERRPLVRDSDREVRRLVPARDDLRPLYVTGYGLSIGKSDEVLKIRDRDGVVQESRLHDISQVNVFGNVTLTSAAVEALCAPAPWPAASAAVRSVRPQPEPFRDQERFRQQHGARLDGERHCRRADWRNAWRRRAAVPDRWPRSHPHTDRRRKRLPGLNVEQSVRVQRRRRRDGVLQRPCRRAR